MTSTHQPGQDVFRPVRPEAIDGEYVTQVTAIGPLGLEYLDLEDDPRND